MASIYDIKPKFQALLRPLVRGLAGAGVTANQVTLFALALSVGVGVCTWLLAPADPRWLFALPATLFVRMALNAIDGMLAREHDMRSDLGAMLNELGDVLADAALYLPLAFVPGFSAALIVGITVLAISTELAGVLGPVVGASRRYDGPMGKSDRAFVFGFLALIVGCGVSTGPWLFWTLVVVAALTAFTILNRVRWALREKATAKPEAATTEETRT